MRWAVRAEVACRREWREKGKARGEAVRVQRACREEGREGKGSKGKMSY